MTDRGGIFMNRFLAVCGSVIMTLSAFFLSGAGTVTEHTETAYQYTIQDIRNLQDFLLARPVEEDLTDKPYDINYDDCWNVFDLCLMKRELMENRNTESGNDTLVVYFSRTGNTEKIAEYLINIAQADRYVIEAFVPYSDEDIQYQTDCRANREQNDKTVRPEIANLMDSIDSYDTVFLGYPIWWGEEPRIIDTFLESYDFSEKTVIPFCTSGSSGISVSEKNISQLVKIGNQPEGRRFSANASKQDVKMWYDTLPLNQKTETKLILSVDGTELTASLADSIAAQELAEKLKAEPVTVTLNEYGGFEKVGKLPWSLIKSDEPVITEIGDIMLYQGNQMTVFYQSNSWNYTKLGHIDNMTSEELISLFGDGAVTVTLSVK